MSLMQQLRRKRPGCGNKWLIKSGGFLWLARQSETGAFNLARSDASRFASRPAACIFGRRVFRSQGQPRGMRTGFRDDAVGHEQQTHRLEEA